VPVIVLDINRGAGRAGAAADRVIFGEVALAAKATVVLKVSAATQANKTSLVFMIFDLSNHWTMRQQRGLLIKVIARVTQPLPCPRTYWQALSAFFGAVTDVTGKDGSQREANLRSPLHQQHREPGRLHRL